MKIHLKSNAFRIAVFLVAAAGVFAAWKAGMPANTAVAEEYSKTVTSDRILLYPGEERYVRYLLPVETDSYVTSLVPKITQGDNLIHHLIFIYDGRRSDYYSCKGQGTEDILFTSGKELADLHLPDQYGFFVKRGSNIIVESHLSNESSEILTSSFAVDVSFQQNKQAVQSLHLVTGVPANAPCVSGIERPLSFPVPSGIETMEKFLERPFTAKKDMEIVYWGGHMHDFGVSVELLRNGNSIAKLRSEDSSGIMHREGVYVGGSALSVPLYMLQGDAIDLKVVYKKPLEVALYDAMGIGYVIFKADD